MSTKHLEGERPCVKQNGSSEMGKSLQGPFRGSFSGIRTHLFLLGDSTEGNDASCEYSCSSEEQSLLEALVLSQWEDRSWKGQLCYDITTCETKVINGGKQFIAQMNDKWNLNTLSEFENKAFQPSGLIKSSYMRTHSDDILICVASGENESSEIIPSTLPPSDGILVLINANPIEYGHIFLVPYDVPQRPRCLDKRTLELMGRMTAEINNSSFRIFYDYTAFMNSDHVYFQAGYFGHPLSVEHLPTVPVFGNSVKKGLFICEIADYPLNALVFMSMNLNLLAEVVAEVCSALEEHSHAFSLLISDRGKVFLFPQVHSARAGYHLPSWECGGYFVCNRRCDFDNLSEDDLSERLTSVSLDSKGFQALKQLCCDVAVKFAP